MIKLNKSDEPKVLEAKGKEWAKAYLGKIAAGEKPTGHEETRYRHPEIKAALIQETAGKCAYCESKLLHIHHGDVEHIYPKSANPDLRFAWRNLTLSCEICNQNKSDRDPCVEHIIDPYEEEPEKHLLFLGTMAYAKGTTKGVNTLVLLDLNRAELLERRQEKLAQIMNSVSMALSNSLPLATRKIIMENIRAVDASSGAPYSAMVKSVLSIIESASPEA